MKKVRVRFVTRNMTRRYGADPVDIPEDIANKYIAKGFARIEKEKPGSKDESISSSKQEEESESSASSDTSSSSESSSQSSEDREEDAEIKKPKISVKIKKK